MRRRLGRPDRRLGGVDGLGDALPRRPRATPIFAATSSSSGPRCSVFMWMMPLDAVGAARALAAIRRCARGSRTPRAAGSWSRSRARSRRPPAAARSARCRRRRSRRCSVTRRQHHADEREGQADQRGEVLEQDHRQLGLLGPADELRERRLPADLVGLDDRGAEGEALQHDRDQQDDRRRRTTTGCRRSRPRARRWTSWNLWYAS